MTNIFLKLVDMSISASWIILAVIAAYIHDFRKLHKAGGQWPPLHSQLDIPPEP